MRHQKLSKLDYSDIPADAKGFRAHNGITARLYHYMTHSLRFQEDGKDKALVVQVPHTTAAKMFRIHVLSYMHKRGLAVSTSVRDKTEILVWLRDGGYRSGDRLCVPFEASELAALWPAGSDEEYSEDREDDSGDEDETREIEKSLVKSLKAVEKILGVGSGKVMVPSVRNVARLTDFGQLNDLDVFRRNLKKHLGAGGDERTWQMPGGWAEAWDDYWFGPDGEYAEKRNQIPVDVGGDPALKQHYKRKKRLMRFMKRRR